MSHSPEDVRPDIAENGSVYDKVTDEHRQNPISPGAGPQKNPTTLLPEPASRDRFGGQPGVDFRGDSLFFNSGYGGIAPIIGRGSSSEADHERFLPAINQQRELVRDVLPDLEPNTKKRLKPTVDTLTNWLMSGPQNQVGRAQAAGNVGPVGLSAGTLADFSRRYDAINKLLQFTGMGTNLFNIQMSLQQKHDIATQGDSGRGAALGGQIGGPIGAGIGSLSGS